MSLPSSTVTTPPSKSSSSAVAPSAATAAATASEAATSTISASATTTPTTSSVTVRALASVSPRRFFLSHRRRSALELLLQRIIRLAHLRVAQMHLAIKVIGQAAVVVEPTQIGAAHVAHL